MLYTKVGLEIYSEVGLVAGTSGEGTKRTRCRVRRKGRARVEESIDSATRTGKLGLSIGWPGHLCAVIWFDLGDNKLQVGQLRQLIRPYRLLRRVDRFSVY